MEIEKIKSEDYEEMFRIDFLVGYYISELFMHNYKNFNVLLIYNRGTWQTFMPKDILENLLAEGVSFYKSRDSFLKYKEEFDRYMKESQKFLDKYKTLPEKITRQIFYEIRNTIRQHWVHYYRTEFFYSNQAYVDAKKEDTSESLKKNLEELEDIKTNGRLLLNAFTLSPDSLYLRLMHKSSEQYNIDEDLIGGLSYNEFIELLEKGSVNLLEAKKRKESFALVGDNGRLIHFNLEDSEKICKIFFGGLENIETIKGTVANQGNVKGKVLVIPSKVFTEELIQGELKKMDECQILVAHTTSPDLIELCKKAKAIITDQGGLGSHAAIVSRELNIPCIVGTKIATKVLRERDEVEVDANNGVVKIIR